jgi:outer membrane protein OmpA-like peptidoglycan-associated protein
MKNIGNFLLLILLLNSCANTQVLAQTDGNKKAQEFYNQGIEAQVFAKYKESLAFFEQAIQADPKYVDAYLQACNLYQNLHLEYDKALHYYEVVIELDKTLHQSYFEAAKCALSLQNFEKAKLLAESYLQTTSQGSTQYKDAQLLLKSIAFSKQAVANPVNFLLLNLGPNVNSDKAEYFPSITADNEFLYFTVNDETQRYPNEDIYAARYVSGKWEPRKAVSSVNGVNSQEGAHCITQDGRYLFFASDRQIDNLGKFDIYLAKKVGDDWKQPANLGNVINSRYWESQPVISADSKLLFFVRKSNDGFGGSDIYMSKLSPETGFSLPVNLGSIINTSGDEQRPYLHPDGKTLYFASNGHPGLGKTDLFKTTLQEDGTWSEPVNLGYPINTEEVEFGLYVAADGKTAYISSSREGGYGDMDLYSFELPENARPEWVLSVKGKVFDAATNQGLKADIKIIELLSGEIYKTFSSDEINGNFLLTLPLGKDYIYQANAEGYLPFSESFSLSNANLSSLIYLEAPLEKVAKGKEFVLKNIFFDTNDFTLQEASKTELKILVNYLKKNITLYLEVGGHTDSDGVEAANLLLSEKRAKAVYDYLILQGVPSTQITYKGYGELSPMHPNDSPENKAKNRRTAFKVL